MHGAASRRALAAVAAAVLAATCTTDAPDRPPVPRVDGDVAPNVVVVVTDDQTFDSMRGAPVAMPWLRSQLARPGWTTFTNAVVSTPLCCPSRVSMLTGRYARTTGVRTNRDGATLDPSTTIAARLQAAGYRTALVGKYLNGYPWDEPPSVPLGWDRFFAKLNASLSTTYYGYDVVDDGTRSTVGRAPDDYATDRLAAEALTFVERAPTDRPFFLWFAPSAPHDPAEPAPRHASLLDVAAEPPHRSDSTAMNDVRGAPGWIRELDPIGRSDAAALADRRLRERVALRSVDEAMHALWGAVERRGELHRTAWLFLSDNGYSFGDRRWVGKTCPWEVCVHVPFVTHVPGTEGGVTDALVANIDVAPTVAELAGVELGAVDGRSLVSLLEGEPSGRARAVLLDWIGDDEVPGWVGVRLHDAVLIRHADGTEELYDLAADPRQRTNLAEVPAAHALRSRTERALARFLAAVGTGG